MRKVHNLMSAIVFVVVACPLTVRSQCDCNHLDPRNGQSSCNVSAAAVSGQGSQSVCAAASCSSGSNYNYTFDYSSFSPNPDNYFWKITGGWVYEDVRYANGGVVSTHSNRCSGNPNSTDGPFIGEYANFNGMYKATLRVRWDNTSPNHFIEVWAYSSNVGNGTFTLRFYNCVSPSSIGTAPAAPTAITLSSPTYFPCGFKVACTYIPNAQYYQWTGTAYGTFTDIVGPAVAENQIANFCVWTQNACGNSPQYCTSVPIGNNNSCGSRIGHNNDSPLPPAKAELLTQQVIISPNPAKDRVSIYFSKPGNYSIQIISMAGKVNKSLEAKAASVRDIDLSDLPKGLYVVIIQNDKTIVTKKFLLE